MDYSVTIDKFEGPLDLLLHLIKQNDIDIFDINIADITQQYLNYIKAMKDLNLDVGSEYLVMAADLTLIKSRELLPVEDEEEDLKEELIDRLVEYQKYKEASLLFKDLENERSQSFSKLPSLLNEFKSDDAVISDNITIEDLLKALEKFAERKEIEKPLNTVVTRKEYSVYERGLEIIKSLKVNKKMAFEDLFEVYSKDYIVVTFLSILDLAKKGELTIKQDSNMDKIMLMAKGVEA